MLGKILVIGVMAVIVVLTVSIMNVASMEDDASEKWLEEHKKQ